MKTRTFHEDAHPAPLALILVQNLAVRNGGIRLYSTRSRGQLSRGGRFGRLRMSLHVEGSANRKLHRLPFGLRGHLRLRDMGCHLAHVELLYTSTARLSNARRGEVFHLL